MRALLVRVLFISGDQSCNFPPGLPAKSLVAVLQEKSRQEKMGPYPVTSCPQVGDEFMLREGKV